MGDRGRVHSIDALRGLAVLGMVMVDLVGDEDLHPVLFRHSGWEGLRVADVVFPAFLVAAGLSLHLSRRQPTMRSVLVRAGRLILIGLLIVAWGNRALGLQPGVLQFIGVSWLGGALLTRLERRSRLVAALALVVAVTALRLGLHPGGAPWSESGLDATIDTALFGSRNDLGLLGMSQGVALVATASVLGEAGVLPRRDAARSWWCVGAGLAAVWVGVMLWVGGLPVVKRLWTPSYLALGLGVSLVVLGVLDALGRRRWGRALLRPALDLGSNALAMFVALVVVVRAVPDSWGGYVVDRLDAWLPSWLAATCWPVGWALLFWAIAAELRRRRIVIRV